MTTRVLTDQDAEAYQHVRLTALNERPPAFGSLPEDEPTLPSLRERLPATGDRLFFGAFEGNDLVGIARLSKYESANEKHRAYLAGLYVLPPHRGRGYGSALVRSALDHAAADGSIIRVNLTVVSQQLPAIRLYENLGFTICGTDPETFSCDGKFYDEHLMTLNLREGRKTDRQSLIGPDDVIMPEVLIP